VSRAAVRYVPWRETGARPNIVVDGAPLPSTVLTLSHWPSNSTPERYKRDTSTETALAWVARHDPMTVAGVVTNNHFDEDGLFSMFAVVEPRRALARGELLADAARAGDFGCYRDRAAARLCFLIEAHADPEVSPLPAATFVGSDAARTAALYRQLLPRLPRLIDGLGADRRYWGAQDEHLELSEELVANGRVAIEEEPQLDLAIVRIPVGYRAREARRYLRPEPAPVHPFAIHNATRCTRLVRIQGRQIELQYRYESWLQLQSRRPALRVDLAPFCRWLNRRERNGRWHWDGTFEIAPRLHLEGGRASSIEPAAFLRELRRCLLTLPAAWDPHNWRAATRGLGR
jgi:hypothetical protein